MTNYDKLLKKYEKYVPGEKRSQEYDHQVRLEARLKNRMLIVDELALEAKYLRLTNSQKQTVKYLVKVFNNDFKSLHRRASDETIILAFIFYMKKLDTPKIQLKNYRITKKYNLTDTIFELILCRVTNYFMLTSPLHITSCLKDNHEEMVKTGDYP